MPRQSNTDLVIIDEKKFQDILKQRRILTGHDEIQVMLEDIRPVLRLGDEHFYADIDRMNVRYVNLYDGPIEHNPVSLREYDRILTLHRYTRGDQFEPYVTEVLAMFPPNIPSRKIAFEVLNPFEAGGGIDDQRVAFNHGYHVAWTILYELAE